MRSNRAKQMDFVTIIIDDTTFLTAKHDTKATFYWTNKAIYSRSLRFDKKLNDEDGQVAMPAHADGVTDVD